MTIFDFLFVAVVLATAVTLLLSLVATVRGRRARAGILVRRVGVGAGIYLGVLLLVSAFTPQRYRRPGDPACSDDWCIDVQSAHREPRGSVVRYSVAFQLACRARRVAQRERFVTVYLLDDRGRQYFPLADPKAVPFDTLLQAGETLAAPRQFDVPGDARVVGAVVSREGGGRFPRCCIIGDEDSFLHRRTIIRLE